MSLVTWPMCLFFFCLNCYSICFRIPESHRLVAVVDLSNKVSQPEIVSVCTILPEFVEKGPPCGLILAWKMLRSRGFFLCCAITPTCNKLGIVIAIPITVTEFCLVQFHFSESFQIYKVGIQPNIHAVNLKFIRTWFSLLNFY